MSIFLSSSGVKVRGEFRVQQLQELDRKWPRVVVHLTVALRSVITPSIADITLVEVIHISFEALGGEWRAILLQAQISKHAEPEPIRVGHLARVDRAQPRGNIVLLLLRQLIPERVPGNRQRIPDGTHLHHPLIKIFHRTPVFGVVRIGPVDQSVYPLPGPIVLPTACEQRPQAPQRTGEAFQLSASLIVPCGCSPNLYACVRRRESQSQRIQERDAGFLEITFCAERASAERMRRHSAIRLNRHFAQSDGLSYGRVMMMSGSLLRSLYGILVIHAGVRQLRSAAV